MPLTSRINTEPARKKSEFPKLIKHTRFDAVALVFTCNSDGGVEARILHPGKTAWAIGDCVKNFSEWVDFTGSVTVTAE